MTALFGRVQNALYLICLILTIRLDAFNYFVVIIVICNSFVEHLIEYCTTCHWRNCTTNDDLNFKTNCICSKKKHKKFFVKICNSYYSFKCKICKQTHDLVVTKPLQFYCSFQTITSDTYNHWNRQSTHFCSTCLLNRSGKNLGFCWFCEICKQHQLNYVNGSEITIYNEGHKTQYNGRFFRCFKCKRLLLTYTHDITICPCNNF